MNTSSSVSGVGTKPRNMSSPPIGEPTSSQAMYTSFSELSLLMTEYNPRPANTSNSTSQNIGRIVGPVVGVVVLIILVAVGIVILKRRRKRILLPMEPPKVSPYPNTTSASNGMGAGKGQPVTRTLLELENPTREEASSSIGNDDLPHQEDREQDAEIAPPMRERRVIYHDDSGWRPSARRSDAENSSVLEMPPRYDAAI
ncbi:hypothetical protein VNI00_015114 [Paramarasmius palmivorus]|uniref:Uncharacterized protein n=1 Tax=Paramarasmius palmivorus TaxID=297713 RepID=A0AAW0BLU7_9AGAR